MNLSWKITNWRSNNYRKLTIIPTLLTQATSSTIFISLYTESFKNITYVIKIYFFTTAARMAKLRIKQLRKPKSIPSVNFNPFLRFIIKCCIRICIAFCNSASRSMIWILSPKRTHNGKVVNSSSRVAKYFQRRFLPEKESYSAWKSSEYIVLSHSHKVKLQQPLQKRLTRV